MIWAERRGRFGSGCLAPVTNASFAVPNAGAQLSRFRAEPPRSLRPRLARGPVWPCAREARATLPSASGLPSPSALGLTRGRGRPPSTRPEKARKPAGNSELCCNMKIKCKAGSEVLKEERKTTGFVARRRKPQRDLYAEKPRFQRSEGPCACGKEPGRSPRKTASSCALAENKIKAAQENRAGL
ncbi:uncharacterized protein VSU04_003269 isoform 1-T1 [Chlamydotis macqueenii]